MLLPWLNLNMCFFSFLGIHSTDHIVTTIQDVLWGLCVSQEGSSGQGLVGSTLGQKSAQRTKI